MVFKFGPKWTDPSMSKKRAMPRFSKLATSGEK